MKVRVRNPEHARQHVWFFHQPEFFEYEGEEVKPHKWQNPSEILCLTTGMSDFPVRSIPRKYIVAIDNASYESPKTDTNKIISKVVQGSKGNEYLVTNSQGRWTCTCPGFTFRQSCKHTAAAVA